jgi:hypothetical protein
MPQSLIGHGFTQARNTAGIIDRVEYLGGATFGIAENVENYHGWAGVSLGNYINVKLKDTYKGFSDLFWHEYGHTKDSKLFGWAYLFTIGIPSASGADWTEDRANKHAENYKKKHNIK